jgi:hypothetical protein
LIAAVVGHPVQLDLFAQAPTDDGAVVDWDRFRALNAPAIWQHQQAKPWATRKPGATCGGCQYFIGSQARAGRDGYCSFHAFDLGDPRKGDGTGWHFYAAGQACTLGANT